MWGFWIALGMVAGLALLAWRRPVLARMGVGYAMQRKRQTILITAGLMIATTVIAAAGIAADSSARSFTESILGRIHLADASVSSFDGSLVAQEDVEAIVEDPALAEHVAAHSVGVRLKLPFESASTGRGDKEVVTWGLDPATYSRIANYEAVEGEAPASVAAWPDGAVVVNKAAATTYGIAVGDPVHVFLAARQLVVPQHTDHEGRFELSAQTPMGGYTHHPDDVHMFKHNSTGPAPGGGITFRAQTDADVDLHLFVTAPHGEQRQAGPSRGEAEVAWDAAPRFAEGAVYRVEVHSPLAAQVDFTVNVTEDVTRNVGGKVLEAEAIGVLVQEGSDPIGFGPAVYMPLPALQGFLEQPDHANALLIDFKDGTDLDAMTEPLRDAARDAWSPRAPDVRNDRAELEREREEIELAVQATFLGIGSFSILAGFMLIGVLMALLVEERKRVLATSRALGAGRSDLTRMHAHEGSLYAAFAAVAGLLGAVLLATVIMRLVQTMFASQGARFVLIAKTETVLSAIGFGFALTLAVITWAAYRMSRIHIVAALRGEEAEAQQGRVAAIVLAALGATVGVVTLVAGIASGDPVSLVLGPTLLAFGLAPLLARLVGRTSAFGAVGTALSVYVVASFWFLAPPATGGEGRFFLLFPARGIILAFSIAVTAAYSGWFHAFVVRGLSWIPRSRPLLESALGHLRQRPGRAALTIAMFGTVLVILTALGTLFATFEPNDLGDAGGYDVLADTTVDLGDPQAYLEDHPPASGIDPFDHARSWVATPWLVNGANELHVTKQLPDGGTGSTTVFFPFSQRIGDSAVGVTPEWRRSVDLAAAHLSPGHASMDEALAAVAADPALVVLAQGASYYDFEADARVALAPGDVLQAGRDGPEVRVIGTVAGSGVAGVYVHPQTLQILAESARFEEPGTRIWIDAEGSKQDAAAAFESAFRRTGLKATVADDVAPEDAKVAQAFQAIIALFLGLGIIIGMVSLALIMGRNVLLRRPEIGTLRAMGAQPPQVLGMFSFEALYLATWSIGIGLGVGLLLAWGMVSLEEIFVPFRIDWDALLLLYGVTLVAALLAAFIPAWRASRIAPAQAVRHSE